MTHSTPVRRKVLAFLIAMSALAYVQRLSLSAVASDIAAELHLSPATLGTIFSAFTLFYALFEVPGGWLGDRFGSRRILACLVTAWSICTVMTAAAGGLFMLALSRALLGAGEAGAFPNAARTISRWFPFIERGRALGTTFLGLALGSAITTPLLLHFSSVYGWRAAMAGIALPGLFWAAAWYWFFRDYPVEHRGVTQEERAVIGEAAAHAHHQELHVFRTLWRESNLGRVCGVYFAFGYGIYFYITWMPTYFRSARGFSRAETGLWSAVLWLMGGLGYVAGGYATDWLFRRYGDLRIARCRLGAAAYAASAIALLIVAGASAGWIAAVALSFAAFFQFVAAPSVWSICIDIGRERAGSVTGFMNMIGNVGGTIAPSVVGWSVGRFGSWTVPFIITAILFILGIILWLRIDATKRIDFLPMDQPARSNAST